MTAVICVGMLTACNKPEPIVQPLPKVENEAANQLLRLAQADRPDLTLFEDVVVSDRSGDNSITYRIMASNTAELREAVTMLKGSVLEVTEEDPLDPSLISEPSNENDLKSLPSNTTQPKKEGVALVEIDNKVAPGHSYALRSTIITHFWYGTQVQHSSPYTVYLLSTILSVTDLYQSPPYQPTSVYFFYRRLSGQSSFNLEEIAFLTYGQSEYYYPGGFTALVATKLYVVGGGYPHIFLYKNYQA